MSQNNELPKKEDYILILTRFGFNIQITEVGYAYTEKCMVNGVECRALNVIEPLF